MTDIEVTESRANALLREAVTTGAEKRSAMITLADRALIAADGDEEAAKQTLREALEIIGALPYEPGQPYRQRGIETLTTNYERPGS